MVKRRAQKNWFFLLLFCGNVTQLCHEIGVEKFSLFRVVPFFCGLVQCSPLRKNFFLQLLFLQCCEKLFQEFRGGGGWIDVFVEDETGKFAECLFDGVTSALLVLFSSFTKKQLHGFPLSGILIAFLPFFLAKMMLHQTTKKKKKRRANRSYSFCCFSIETMLMRWKERLVGSIFPFLLKCFSIALMGNDSSQHLGKSTFFFLGNHVASNCGKRTSMAKRELFRNVSI